MDKQLTLDLQIPVTYKKFSGTCKCGYKWEYERCNIVMEMNVICPECGEIIKVGKVGYI